ncbi:MAG: DUF1579 family protein [Cyclobacteriaceae bacterium]
MNNLLLLGLLLTFVPATTRETGEVPPETLYDFWVGEWELTWTGRDGETYHGENTIRKIMNGKVIEENFRALDGELKGYEGRSWSVYDEVQKGWKQTWVDNQGGYLDFDGKADGDRRIFYRVSTDAEGNERHSRMVFYNITEDALDWDWQMSEDAAASWQTVWAIHYKRKGR